MKNVTNQSRRELQEFMTLRKRISLIILLLTKRTDESLIYFRMYFHSSYTALPELYNTSCDVLGCPDGWVTYDNSCLYANPDAMNFTAANQTCNGMGAQLASITDQSELTFICQHV